MAECSTCRNYGYDEICVDCHSNNMLYMPYKGSRWVSVKDRLPKYGERVLITGDTAVFEAYRSASGKWVRMGIGWQENVTHWCPLPEPPEGE